VVRSNGVEIATPVWSSVARRNSEDVFHGQRHFAIRLRELKANDPHEPKGLKLRNAARLKILDALFLR
jgi:hypothetical protein